eukprot:3419697-Prorocentrum_lima.AAC.1
MGQHHAAPHGGQGGTQGRVKPLHPTPSGPLAFERVGCRARPHQRAALVVVGHHHPRLGHRRHITIVPE